MCNSSSIPLSRTAILAALWITGCVAADVAPAPMAEVDFRMDGKPAPLAAQCDHDDGGLLLPRGFCAILVASDLPGTRHLAVAENGDIFVARMNRGDARGGISVLRDSDGDGRADVVEVWGESAGNDVLIAGDHVYFAPNDAVLRYRVAAGEMAPLGPPDTIVFGLPDSMNHSRKSIALGRDGSLYVAIGAPGNSCMVESRTRGSPGMDPCPLLERRGGIWRFDATRTGQSQGDGTRFATGLRNVMALGMDPGSDQLYAVMHGRDQLHDLWPELYTPEESAELPSEEFVRITEGSDFGWPYCYHDPKTGKKVLAPEYGGDGAEVGRCAEKDMPLIGFPAHWAPNDLEFYTGEQFPTYFHDGIFVAFHGSWNRAPLPQDGYYVVFIPADDGGPGKEWSIFAAGFLQEGFLNRNETARPVGIAMGPDGSLYIADSVRGRIWRVLYSGRSSDQGRTPDR